MSKIKDRLYVIVLILTIGSMFGVSLASYVVAASKISANAIKIIQIEKDFMELEKTMKSEQKEFKKTLNSFIEDYRKDSFEQKLYRNVIKDDMRIVRAFIREMLPEKNGGSLMKSLMDESNRDG